VRLVPAAAIDSDRPSVKNTIPVKEYLLATEAVLSRLSEERQKRFTPYEEIYDLGPARAGYEPLGYLWDREQAAQRTEVTANEAASKKQAVEAVAREGDEAMRTAFR
jgi:hypothetical protein